MPGVIKSIHTLNARNNVMLEVFRTYFDLTPEQMHREIQQARDNLESILSAEKISYDALRTALVPSRKNNDVALVFDTLAIQDDWYGWECFSRLIPLLNKSSSHSLLVGDYIGSNDAQDVLFGALKSALIPCRRVEYQHSNQFYIIYVSNVTQTMIQHFNANLSHYEGYVGYADMTCASSLKLILSTQLVNLCVKKGNLIIQGHEDDRDAVEDINISQLPFEPYGYKCKSLASDLFGLFLSYKIERPVLSGFERDTEFSLNAISSDPIELSQFRIYLEEAKHKYLLKEKRGVMTRAGLDLLDIRDLEGLLLRKIEDNYIYNVAYNIKGGTTKFNIMIEVPKGDGGGCNRMLGALEYKSQDKTLRLITLY